MDFSDQLHELSKQVSERIPRIKTEEAAKSGLVMPFIKALGYDVFDPSEVVPEFTADIGEKKGEKVDYAIMKDGKPIMLFECKQCGASLDANCGIQLQRYFHGVPDVRFGILTDGIMYRFFSDLDRPNVMDAKPFFELDITDLDDWAIDELKRFRKPAFNARDILSTAGELKYTREIQSVLRSEYETPSRDLVALMTARVYDGNFTKAAQERFTPLVKRALHGFVSEKLTETLETAKTLQSAPPSGETHGGESVAAEEEQRGIITTAEELQGFYIVKAILAGRVDLQRIAIRDVRSYCGILLDDNNRNPICRLRFNNPDKKCIGLFDSGKGEEIAPIRGVDDIYKFSERIRITTEKYAAQT